MKLIVDKNQFGLETPEFKEYLKTPVLKSEITQDEADELRMKLTQALVENPGLGISATQIGIKKRACYINFGDEYLFFGNVETDIQATVYEMRYYVNLPYNQFTVSTNPTLNGDDIYITEVGLYDSDYDLMFISKLESPQLRQGVQQFLIKYDF